MEEKKKRTGQDDHIAADDLLAIKFHNLIATKDPNTSTYRAEKLCCLRDRLQFLPKP